MGQALKDLEKVTGPWRMRKEAFAQEAAESVGTGQGPGSRAIWGRGAVQLLEGADC